MAIAKVRPGGGSGGGGGGMTDISGKADTDLQNIDLTTNSEREFAREEIGLQDVSATELVAATHTGTRSFSPHDIREIAHNQAVRILPNNGTEVETLRLYYGDDAAWDEEVYVCIQDHTLEASSRPEAGSNWETYFEKVTTRIRQVTSLGAPADVSDRNLGKLHIVRPDYDGIPSFLAHVTTVDDEKLGELTTETDGQGRIGYSVGASSTRGHLSGYSGITRLDEILHTGGQHQLLMHVSTTSEIPRENSHQLVYLREQGSTADWWEVPVANGADGTYESSGYSGARTLESGKRYDVYVRSTSSTGTARVQTSTPVTTNRYDFYPDSRNWSVFAEKEDLDQNTVIIRDLVNDTVQLTEAQATDDTDTDFGTVSGERLSQAVAEFETGGTELTQAQVEDDASTDFGTVSGQRLSQAVAEFETGGALLTSTQVTDSSDTDAGQVSGERLNEAVQAFESSQGDAWATTEDYNRGEEVYHSSVFWKSNNDSNIGNEPTDSSSDWERLVPVELSQAQVESDTSDVYGQVSGERLAQAVAAHEGGGALQLPQAGGEILLTWS